MFKRGFLTGLFLLWWFSTPFAAIESISLPSNAIVSAIATENAEKNRHEDNAERNGNTVAENGHHAEGEAAENVGATGGETAFETGTSPGLPPVDTTPPRIFIQQPTITVEATSPRMTVNLGVVTAVDLVSGAITPTNNAPAAFPLGVTQVTWSATDAAGNTATAVQIVVVQDTTPPVITAPGPVAVDSPSGQPMAVNIGTATATDAFGPVSITNNAPAIFPIGNTTVTWTATDANGNTATATQLVTVNDTSVLAGLPPDPGPAGKLTLAGIDSDGDGVRDDVQRWIALTFPHSQKTRAALTQLAKAYQALLLNANDKQLVYDAGVQLSRSIDCLYYIDGVNAAAFAHQLEAVVMNTALRSRTYIQASHNLSGRGFIGLSNQIQGCQFNPNLMPN